MEKSSCAFTGHRPLKFPWRYDETDSRCVILKSVLTEQIKALAEAGVTEFLSGMAEGTDVWCAEIVLELRKDNPALKLHCVLPCEGQSDYWSAEAQKRYRDILKQADQITYVNRKYTESCMLERNHWLVDHAGRLLAVYNGEYRGGTAATIRYAQKAKREIRVINPITFQIVRADENAETLDEQKSRAH